MWTLFIRIHFSWASLPFRPDLQMRWSSWQYQTWCTWAVKCQVDRSVLILWSPAQQNCGEINNHPISHSMWPRILTVQGSSWDILTVFRGFIFASCDFIKPVWLLAIICDSVGHIPVWTCPNLCTDTRFVYRRITILPEYIYFFIYWLCSIVDDYPYCWTSTFEK